MNRQFPIDLMHFFTDATLVGCREIRGLLALDYNASRFEFDTNENSRKYYFQGTLNELEKIAISIKSELDFFTESLNNNQEAIDSYDQHLLNMILQGKIDIAELWKRKLSEILVDTVGFKYANEDNYYKHFILIEKLAENRSKQQNKKDFHSCINKLLNKEEESLISEINAIENNIDKNKLWHVKEKHKQQSFSKQLIFIFTKLDPHQQFFLRDYEASFGEASKSLHPNNLTDQSNLAINDLGHRLNSIIILSALVISSINELLENKITMPKTVQVISIFSQNKKPNEILENLWINPGIAVNDLVIIQEKIIAQVIAVKTNDFLYKTFRVKQIDHSFQNYGILSTEEDEFTARELRLFQPEQGAIH